MTTVNCRVIQKHGTETDWVNSELVPYNGELIVYDPDDSYSYSRFKVGDGVHNVTELPFSVIQSDWKQTDKTALDFIKNKPETLVECPSEEIVADILQNVYPVGAIYLSANNISPASLFGGTWEQIQDRFLLSAGSAYTAGSTGGESTHTLTVQEMPVHSHTVNAHSHAIGLDNDTTIGTYGWSLHVNANGNSVTGAQKIVTSGTSSPNTNTIGGGVAHNNMPPYLTVYMWKRIE